MHRHSCLDTFLPMLVVAASFTPACGATVVYSNQTTFGLTSTGFNPLPVVWDDLQLTGGGTLSEISLIARHSNSSVRNASGYIDIRVFDEANNRPQGTPIAVIPFNGTFLADPLSSSRTVIGLSSLQSMGIMLPSTGRIGVGIQFDDSGWSFPGAGPPTVGSSPGGDWTGNSSFERSDSGGDFAWKVVVAETAPIVRWNKSSGAWGVATNWDTGAVPESTQDVIVRSTGGVASVTGPIVDTTVKSVQVGELAFSNTTLVLQPEATLTVTESFLVSVNGFLDINGGRLVTGDFNVPTFTFNSGTVEVHGGEFSPTIFDYSLSGTGNPTVILDDATFNAGFGATHEDLLVANSIGQTGSFTARNGATVTAQNVTVGNQRASDGQLTLSGIGTTLEVFTKLALGQNAGTSNNPARGTLLMENSAVATVAEMDVGAAGYGVATIDNATLNVVENPTNTKSGELRIGGIAPSMMTIQNGGIVNAEIVDVASSTATTATLVVTGNGSRLNAPGGIAVGDSNEGKFRVLAGAQVTTGTLATGFTASPSPTKTNEIQIDGALTRVNVTGTIRADVDGMVTISGGAQVTANLASASSGPFTVTGNGTLLDTSNTLSTIASVTIRNTEFRVENGAIVRSRGLELGSFNATSSSVVVTGAGSLFESNGLFFLVGNTVPGTLTVDAGGEVKRTGDVIVTAATNATGNLTVSGVGSRMHVVGDFYLSGGRVNNQVYSFPAVGQLHVNPGATVDVEGTIEPFAAGRVNLQGGNLIADEITLRSGGQFNFTAGRLTVDSFVGNLVNIGGTLAPGNTPSNTNVTGDYTQYEGASLEIEIGGLTPGTGFDKLVVSGTVNLDGNLDISLIGGFTPTIGQQFTILTAGSVINNGLALTGPAAASFAMHVSSSSVILQAITPGDFNGDSRVDAADYVVWRKNAGTQGNYDIWRSHFGQATVTFPPGDFNGDNNVDAADFVIWRKTDGTPDAYSMWRTNFGNIGSGGSASHVTVPEPAASLLLLLGLAIRGWRKRRLA